jgi:GT2 family glycosyltransferase
MKPNVTIIVLNWNGWRDTIQCLESLRGIHYENHNIILVDNASDDASLNHIDAYCRNELRLVPRITTQVVRKRQTNITHYEHACLENEINGRVAAGPGAEQAVTLVQNARNYGFAEGNNVGVDYALTNSHPDYVLLLNNDTVVEPFLLVRLVSAAERDQQVGLAQPKILTYAASTTTADASGADHPAFDRAEDMSEEAQFEREIEEGFFYARAACVLIRKNVLLTFFGECFDPLLFAYFEDVDLSWMARLAGFKVLYCPESVCYHKLRAAFGERSAFTTYLHDRNTLRVMIKNYSTRTLMFALPFTIVLTLWRSAITSVISLNSSELYGLMNGLIWNVVHLRGTLARRRCIQAKRNVADREIWGQILPYPLSVRSRLTQVWARRRR